MTMPEAVVACVAIICATSLLGIAVWRGWQSPGSRYLDHVERQTWTITPRDQEASRDQ